MFIMIIILNIQCLHSIKCCGNKLNKNSLKYTLYMINQLNPAYQKLYLVRFNLTVCLKIILFIL